MAPLPAYHPFVTEPLARPNDDYLRALLDEVRAAGCEVILGESGPRITGNTKSLLPRVVDLLKKHRAAVVDYLTQLQPPPPAREVAVAKKPEPVSCRRCEMIVYEPSLVGEVCEYTNLCPYRGKSR